MRVFEGKNFNNFRLHFVQENKFERKYKKNIIKEKKKRKIQIKLNLMYYFYLLLQIPFIYFTLLI